MPIVGDTSLSRINIKRGFDFSRDLYNIRQRVIRRIFVRGERRDGSQMQRARRDNLDSLYQYRYYTGQLADSTRVSQPDEYSIFLTFEREEIILRYLEDRYGGFLGFSNSEIEYLIEIARRQNEQRLNNLF